MRDDGLAEVDFTGRWVGFYRHRWEQLGIFPMTAELVQTGNKIAGEMYDQVTEKVNNFDSLLEIMWNDLSYDRRLGSKLLVSLFGTETICSTNLPDTADITGKINGDRIEFTKAYRGDCEYSYTVGDRQVYSIRLPNHKVRYAGRLDRATMCITGTWLIRQRGLLGWLLPPAARGTFETYRKS